MPYLSTTPAPDKKPYYLSIHPHSVKGDIIDNPTDTSFDYEVLATPGEIRQLQELFEMAYDEDLGGEPEEYDEALDKIYQLIYHLGSSDTRRRLESIGIHGEDHRGSANM
ncbi:hypothetical protein [Brevibacillus laterosporus]|uniref:hypothetical protein n=1 Tax=Brevibacillus laterosporus TaxID=1465 RepID=UPI0026500BE9|nr:hypothetical protein [Brevibacillus laterosporus]MDN9008565.1 hypothetical protein [Brevibacillus laterosporus]MDO0939651.1 hypothetical protein [Brevibacillus laterosporus]